MRNILIALSFLILTTSLKAANPLLVEKVNTYILSVKKNSSPELVLKRKKDVCRLIFKDGMDIDEKEYKESILYIASRLEGEANEISPLLFQLQIEWNSFLGGKWSREKALYRAHLFNSITGSSVVIGTITALTLKRYFGLVRHILWPAVTYYMGGVIAKKSLDMWPLPGGIPPPPALLVDFGYESKDQDIAFNEHSILKELMSYIGATSAASIFWEWSLNREKGRQVKNAMDPCQAYKIFGISLNLGPKIRKAMDLISKLHPLRFAGSLIAGALGATIGSEAFDFQKSHVLWDNFEKAQRDFELAQKTDEILKNRERLIEATSRLHYYLTIINLDVHAAASENQEEDKYVAERYEFAKQYSLYLSYFTEENEGGSQNAEKLSFLRNLSQTLSLKRTKFAPLVALRAIAVLRNKETKDEGGEIASYLADDFQALGLLMTEEVLGN